MSDAMMLPPVDRRRLITQAMSVGTLCALPAATACAQAGARAGAVDVRALRQPGDIDDTEAFDRAFAIGRPVHAPAGGGTGPGGRYEVAHDHRAQLPNGLYLFGDGRERTIIQLSARRGRSFIFHADSRSSDPARNVRGLRFSDLTLADDVARLGFQEYSYLVMLNGVSDAQFERVGFRGFRGDGLHLGASVISKTERHNQRVGIRDCVFDGVNANNRNAISVIDCDGLVIENCDFIDCTRPGGGSPQPGDPMDPRTGPPMPGPIDLEPNADRFAVIRNIVIRENRFRGGGGYAVAINLRSNDAVAIPQRTIVIERNRISNRYGGFHSTGYPAAGGGAWQDYGVRIADNDVAGCIKPFVLDGLSGLTLANTRFRDCTEHAELGYTAGNRQVILRDCTFERIGTGQSGYALWIRTLEDARIVGNRFIDVGRQTGARHGIAMAFVAGRTRRAIIAGNSFLSPGRRSTEAFTVWNDATFDRTTVSAHDNQIGFTAPDGFARFGLGD